MLPGVVVGRGVPPLGQFPREQPRSLTVYGNAVPVGVGCMALSSADIEKTGMTGRGLLVYHSWGDSLWDAFGRLPQPFAPMWPESPETEPAAAAQDQLQPSQSESQSQDQIQDHQISFSPEQVGGSEAGLLTPSLSTSESSEAKQDAKAEEAGLDGEEGKEEGEEEGDAKPVLEEWTVAMLKAELQKRQISSAGTKAALLKRLKQAIEQQKKPKESKSEGQKAGKADGEEAGDVEDQRIVYSDEEVLAGVVDALQAIRAEEFPLLATKFYAQFVLPRMPSLELKNNSWKKPMVLLQTLVNDGLLQGDIPLLSSNFVVFVGATWLLGACYPFLFSPSCPSSELKRMIGQIEEPQGLRLTDYNKSHPLYRQRRAEQPLSKPTTTKAEEGKVQISELYLIPRNLLPIFNLADPSLTKDSLVTASKVGQIDLPLLEI